MNTLSFVEFICLMAVALFSIVVGWSTIWLSARDRNYKMGALEKVVLVVIWTIFIFSIYFMVTEILLHVPTKMKYGFLLIGLIGGFWTGWRKFAPEFKKKPSRQQRRHSER